MYKVSIRCFTYNHALYIEDALKGFVMQETGFPFLAIIVDDASTDNAPQVITSFFDRYFDTENTSVAYRRQTDYGLVLFAKHKTNENCYFAVVLLNENHFSQGKNKGPYLRHWLNDSEYIALCEGDDYWTDPLKLQKQVGFLDSHPDYSLCCHRFTIYHEKSDSWSDDYSAKVFANYPGKVGIDVTNSINFRTRLTWTLTLCYRKSVRDGIVLPPYKYGARDFNLHYHLLKAGKGFCFADYMGVYRMSKGVWASLSRLEMDRFRIDGYKDLYQYQKDDPVVLECYIEWLDRYYSDYALSPFKRHKLTKNGVKSLFFACGHYWRIQGASKAFKQFFNCIMSFWSRNK